MSFDVAYFVDELSIPWGTCLSEVPWLTPGREWQRDDDGASSLHGMCRSAFGLATTACRLWAPAYHRPVLLVKYELAPAPPLSSAAAALTHWLSSLTQQLGPPTELGTGLGRPERGSLLHRSVWKRPGHHISGCCTSRTGSGELPTPTARCTSTTSPSTRCRIWKRCMCKASLRRPKPARRRRKPPSDTPL